MRKCVMSVQVGNMGDLRIETEDKWIYPVFCLDTGQGEYARIDLQHTSIEQLHKIADAFKATAFKLNEKAKV